jgi:hypothetical protein
MGLSSRWLAALAACCLSLLAGCDECSTDDLPTCVAGGIRSCQSTGRMFTGASWYLQKCVAPNPYCALAAPGRQPRCLASPQPVPECASATVDLETPICFQNDPAVCNNGYAQVVGTCDAGPCTVPPGSACAFCDDGTNQADPGCAGGSNSTCFEGDVFDCTCGRRTTLHTDCTSQGQVCIPTGFDYGFEHVCGDAGQDGSFQDDASFTGPPSCNDGGAGDDATCGSCSDATTCGD